MIAADVLITSMIDGQAPRFLLKCTKSGVPIYCVAVVSLITCITFLVSSRSAVEVFYWFVDLTTSGLIATYSFMLLVFVGWHRARVVQGLSPSSLPYVAPLMPYGAYFALFLGATALIFIGFDAFSPFSVQGFITSYFCLPYIAVLFFGWKFFKGTTLVKPETADLYSGKAEVDQECRIWEEGGIEENWKRALQEMPLWKRCWERMW